MMTRAETIRRLEDIEKEISELKKGLLEGWEDTPPDQTKVFLAKCGGWDDSRSPEEIIQDIYESRTVYREVIDLTKKGDSG